MTVEILLVEDDSLDAAFVMEYLRDYSELHVTIVTDGVRALEHLLKSPQVGRPALVLLDLNLPRKDGYEVLQEMKAHPELKSIPVIILTTSNRSEDKTKTSAAGASNYFTKPSSLEGYEQLIKEITSVELPRLGITAST